MNLKNKKVLVTGAGGFIGSHLVEELVGQGAKVTALVRYKSDGSYGFIDELSVAQRKKISVIAGDLKDPFCVTNAIVGQEAVFHLAALIGIPYSYIHPNDYVQTNVQGTAHVLEAARLHKTKKVILTSTSEVYGSAQYTPMDESHPKQPQSPYSASKISADALAESYYRSFNTPVTIVRPFNTYGPRQSPRALIPTIILQALSSKRINIGSLDPQRDFTFVKDTAKGFVAAAESDSLKGEHVNLGVGKTISVGDILEAIIELTEFKGKVVQDKSRVRPKKSEVSCLLSSTDKMQSQTNWKPTVSLKAGLKKCIAYYQKSLDGFDGSRYYQ